LENILNLGLSNSPFDTTNIINSKEIEKQPDIHIRVQKRNGRKCITSMEGIETTGMKLDLEKIISVVKKKFACNGNINNEDGKQIIRLHGDQRKKLADFLIEEEIIDKKYIHIHGY
jgi:translation initiation factor 1